MTPRPITLLLLLLTACTKAPAPPPEVETGKLVQAPVQTDRPRYALREGPFGPETTIVTTFTAPADKTVYLVNCNGAFSMGLQRMVENSWVDVWGAEINSCFSTPIVIPPGGRHSGTMTAASGVDAAVDSRKNDTRIEAGTYRAAWYGLLTSFDMSARPYGEELPLEQRISAPFVIEAPPVPDPSVTTPPVRPAGIASVEPAHAARVAPGEPIRVRFFPTYLWRADVPHLYVDREDVAENVRKAGTDDVPQSMLELEYMPSRRWPPGRHDVRVVYRDQEGNTLWYGWFFTVRGD